MTAKLSILFSEQQGPGVGFGFWVPSRSNYMKPLPSTNIFSNPHIKDTPSQDDN